MLSIVEINEASRDFWDTEVQRLEGCHPFNSYGWGKIRAIDGWEAKYYLAMENGKAVGSAMFLLKRPAYLPVSVMYVPRGILYDSSHKDVLSSLKEKAVLEAKENNAVFLRIDPNVEEGSTRGGDDMLLGSGFVHLPYRWTYWNAPRDVYRLDLKAGGDETELFKLMDPKVRTGVRRAKREGVIIRPAESLADVTDFYRVYKKFSIEKGFLLRSFAYQKVLWDEFISRKKGILALSVYDGEVVGGQICLAFGPMCVEMHRGVYYEYHRLRINEALVWDGILWAKRRGCDWYCLRGIGSGSLQKFKKKFHSRVVSLVGYYDLPFHPLLYRIWICFEFKVLPMMVKALMALRSASSRLRTSIMGRARHKG